VRKSNKIENEGEEGNCRWKKKTHSEKEEKQELTA